MLDPSKEPDADALADFLGGAAPPWNRLIAMTVERAAHLAQAWHFAGARTGWSLRLLDGARILVYLTPAKNQFQVGIVLGAKSVAAAREAGLSAAAAGIIDSAPKFAEGHGVRFVVTSADDLGPFPEFLAIKCAIAAKAPKRSRGASTATKHKT